MPRKRRKLKQGLSNFEKYMEYVVILDGCWGWNGTVNKKNGYGSFAVKNPLCKLNKSNMYAHRFAYSHWNGDIPSGMEVRHTCHNPICSNPEHLIIGTHAENMKDKSIKNNVGEGLTRPTLEEINQIKKILSSEIIIELSEKYQCSIQKILNAAIKNKWNYRTVY